MKHKKLLKLMSDFIDDVNAKNEIFCNDTYDEAAQNMPDRIIGANKVSCSNEKDSRRKKPTVFS